MINDFFEELSEEKLSIRDRHQFELKVDYTPDPKHPKNTFSLDFYFFIPGALQITSNSYSKEQFFQDLTTLIRFKTPDLSFKELLDSANTKSPLYRISSLCTQDPQQMHNEIKQELKLLANIVRSRLREEIKSSLDVVHNKTWDQMDVIDQNIITLCDDFSWVQRILGAEYEKIKQQLPGHILLKYWAYVDEFLSITASDFFLGFLHEIRSAILQDNVSLICDGILCDFIKQQRDYCEQHGYRILTPSVIAENEGEFFVYRKGLLRKFILDVLLLQIDRKESAKKYSHVNHIVAAFAAGVAMLFYLLIFVWRTDSLIINSAPFILGTVFLYILKDRLKEELKTISTRIFKWFPDYTTSIQSPNKKQEIGVLTESFHFLDEKNVPQEILEVRNKEFHQELVEAKRIESVFKYSKTVTLNQQFFDEAGRDYGLNDIFRFNVANFLTKASESHITQLYLDSKTCELETLCLHKVYHINVIIQETYTYGKEIIRSPLRKVRLILDKDGIMRMEMLPN